MKTLTNSKKIRWAAVVLFAAILAGGAVWPGLAQLMGDLPTAQLVLPALTSNSRIRMTGTWVRGRGNRAFPTETIKLRLRLMEEEGNTQDFVFPVALIPIKGRPNELAFTAVIDLAQTGFFALGKVGGGAVITELEELVGRGRGAHGLLRVAAYIEQDNTLGDPLVVIAAYVSWLEEVIVSD